MRTASVCQFSKNLFLYSVSDVVAILEALGSAATLVACIPAKIRSKHPATSFAIQQGLRAVAIWCIGTQNKPVVVVPLPVKRPPMHFNTPVVLSFAVRANNESLANEV